MNYRHLYHAGNFADVFKHIILLALIESLSQKEKPWCYLDTHAGSGKYDLCSEEANKTSEYKNGIEAFLNFYKKKADCLDTIKQDQSNPVSRLIHKYIDIVYQNGYPHYYPGSPFFVKSGMRPKDRMILIEKHPAELDLLRTAFKHQENHSVAIHHSDGYQAIKAFLPPKERRGLIFIDPPFEQADEWKLMIESVKEGLKRFKTGIYAIWYPIKDKRAVEAFQREFQNLEGHNILVAELSIYPEDVPHGLVGCGMVVINPPWHIELVLDPLLRDLWKALAAKDLSGRHQVKWLNV